MPGAGASDSRLGTAIGVTVAAVAVVGYVVYDWTFSDPGSIVPIVIGVLVALLGVGLWLAGD
jgi:hypothetical protein